jgi:glycerol-3-phosphate dehydrogenase
MTLPAPDQSFDVIVIGGGVLGCAIASRLAATTARVCLLEAESDVAEGASKGNAGIAVSYYGGPGDLETELINRSNPGWEELCRRLDVPYRRIGALMIAIDNEEHERLPEIAAEVMACGVRCELLDGAAARRIEPMLTPHCRSAVRLPDEGIIDPMRLTVGFARLAALNGCDVRRATPATGLRSEPDGLTVVDTPRGTLQARFVVNAAGVSSGEVSREAGGEPFVMWPRKGQYAVLDREFGRRLRTIVFSTHLPDTKGVNVVPTTHGSCLLGPTASDHEDIEDRATDADSVAALLESAARLVPAAGEAPAIKYFAANRPASEERMRVRLDTRNGSLLHATNRSTGVSVSPAAAEFVLELLRGAGLEAEDRPDAQTSLTPIPRLRTATHPERLASIDPAYGQVVCACEHVSAAEIAAELRDPVGARSVDAVRKRTGAAYGRCQGSICLAGLTFLCAMAVGAGPADAPLTASGTVGSWPR